MAAEQPIERKKYKFVVGLGNPGAAYQGTRHNAGAQAVKLLARKHNLFFKNNRSFKSLVASGKIESHPISLVLPQTFMNLSGAAVCGLVKKKNIPLKDILIVCDDVALPPGNMKIKLRGSAGGHNGLVSIIERLGSDDFPRLRLGIGRPSPEDDLADYVLSVFRKDEKSLIVDMLDKAVEAIEMWFSEDIEKCMGRTNTRIK